MKNIIVLHTTVANRKDAKNIARILLELNLIACAQIDGPIESMFRWKGSVETSTEYRLSVKSSADLQEQVIKKIQETHPYEVPEITGHILDYCSKEYQNWVIEEVSDVSA